MCNTDQSHAVARGRARPRWWRPRSRRPWRRRRRWPSRPRGCGSRPPAPPSRPRSRWCAAQSGRGSGRGCGRGVQPDTADSPAPGAVLCAHLVLGDDHHLLIVPLHRSALSWICFVTARGAGVDPAGVRAGLVLVEVRHAVAAVLALALCPAPHPLTGLAQHYQFTTLWFQLTNPTDLVPLPHHSRWCPQSFLLTAWRLCLLCFPP